MRVILEFDITDEYGRTRQEKIETTPTLLFHYAQIAGMLYDRKKAEFDKEGRVMREVRDVAVASLVELAYKSFVHENDGFNYHSRPVLTFEQEILWRIEDAATDYDYKWTW